MRFLWLNSDWPHILFENADLKIQLEVGPVHSTNMRPEVYKTTYLAYIEKKVRNDWLAAVYWIFKSIKFSISESSLPYSLLNMGKYDLMKIDETFFNQSYVC